VQRPHAQRFRPATHATAKEAAAVSWLSLPAFWKNVGSGRLPAPSYPAPRCPRWWLSQLRAAIDATACLPFEAKEQRRQARLVRESAENDLPPAA
jgi:hypothetical protein